MTAQTIETLRYNDQDWDLCNIIDDNEAVEELNLEELVPKTEELGFEEKMLSACNPTYNWSGRVDHYLIEDNRLFLWKVEINLAEEYKDFIPREAQREVITTSEWSQDFSSTDDDSWSLCDTTETFFVFEDLHIKFTGSIVCGRNLNEKCILMMGGRQRMLMLIA
ncbi:MAG: hypothetical protein HQM16_18050 [Deltaproteobacteria bacterium]|nr:hypothetical protein [Deltaproteobacteria bacterium]